MAMLFLRSGQEALSSATKLQTAMKPCFLDVSRRIQLKKKSGNNRKIPTLVISRVGILSIYANFFLSFIRRETSKKHGFNLLRWLVFELSDAISEHFIRSMLKKHLSCGKMLKDAKTTFLGKIYQKCIKFAFF
jgi:hypothetical protein